LNSQPYFAKNMSSEPKKVDRRSFLYVGLGAVALIAIGAAAYFATKPPEVVTVTQPTTTAVTTVVTTTQPTTTVVTTTVPTTTVITTTPTTTTSPTTSPIRELQIYNITSLKDLLNIVKHIKYKYEAENKTENTHNIFTCTIDDRGDEIVNGQQTRKIEYEFYSDGETENCTLWISKQDWDTVVKAIINGKEIEPIVLPYIKFHFILLLMPFTYVYNFGFIWTGYSYIGVLQLLTITQVTYGATTLKVAKYKLTTTPEYQQTSGIISMDFDVAEFMQNYDLITGYKITFKDGSYYLYGVEELTLQ
ncbi:MAG: hypothetical protein QXF82_07505, partial [Nitrososphaeria archaeon]